jgi:predicted transposase YbfD/YdcC
LIASVIRVSRLTWHKDTKSGLWHKTDEISLYAAQNRLSAADAADAIRGHWGIENRNHHVRDVTFREDLSRIRTKPVNFARFRTFAINIMRANGADNISREIYINALNPLHAMAYRVA